MTRRVIGQTVIPTAHVLVPVPALKTIATVKPRGCATADTLTPESLYLPAAVAAAEVPVKAQTVHDVVHAVVGKAPEYQWYKS